MRQIRYLDKLVDDSQRAADGEGAPRVALGAYRDSMAVEPRNLVFFPTPGDLRAWLVEHHQRDRLWIGQYKKGSGKPSVTWPDRQVLWRVDRRGGQGHRRYAQRITPRKAGSSGRQHRQGLRSPGSCTRRGLPFEARREDRSTIYSTSRTSPRPSASSRRRCFARCRVRGSSGNRRLRVTARPPRTGSRAPNGRRPAPAGWRRWPRTPQRACGSNPSDVRGAERRLTNLPTYEA